MLDEIYYYRYLINVFLIGVPWTMFAIAMVVYNFWFNIQFNDFWAEGNFWLITNSVFISIEALISIFDAFELPIFLVTMRLLRLVSIFFCFLYIIAFALSIMEWYS